MRSTPAMGSTTHLCLCLLFSLCVLICKCHVVEWTYKGQLAEENWPKKYPLCGATQQSPIDIQKKKVVYKKDLSPFEFEGYEGTLHGKFQITNNGHAVQIGLPPTMKIKKGLPHEYTAVQMHLHWGGLDGQKSGSEHTIDGLRYMAELHIVHYNSELYSSLEEAQDKPHGLAVLAFLYEDGRFENTYYSEIISKLAEIRYAGQVATMKSLNPFAMLPENLKDFYRYEGSLTTPPCTENVLWTVFEAKVHLAYSQINLLESTLHDWNNDTLRSDYRHAQPLNHRVVESSFKLKIPKGEVCQLEINTKLGLIETELQHMKKLVTNEPPKSREGVSHYPSFYFSGMHPASHVQVHLSKPLELTMLTLCAWVKTKPKGFQNLFTYSTEDNDNELGLSVGSDVRLWVGGTSVDFNLHHTSEDWVHYCVRWEAKTGKADLFVSGLQGKEKSLKQGYTVKPGGVAILGKDVIDLTVLFHNSFHGHLSHLHLWSTLLSAEEIMSISKCQATNLKGDIISWGQTAMKASGGVLLEPDNSCW